MLCYQQIIESFKIQPRSLLSWYRYGALEVTMLLSCAHFLVIIVETFSQRLQLLEEVIRMSNPIEVLSSGNDLDSSVCRYRSVDD